MSQALRFAGIVPAAGLSSRMGAFKPLLPLGSSTLLESAVRSCVQAELDPILVVTGHRSEEIAGRLRASPAKLVENRCFLTGMFSSVLAGLQTLPAGVAGCFVLPGDMPLVKPSTFATLIAAFQRTGKSLVQPEYDGYKGHPPLLGSKLFPGLVSFTATGGLRAYLHQHPVDSVIVSVDDPGVLMDADTPADYQQLRDYYAACFGPTHSRPSAQES